MRGVSDKYGSVVQVYMRKTILIVGSSRGIGAELAKHFSNEGHKVLGVSRTRSDACEWIKADISTVDGIRRVLSQIGDIPIDTLLFSSGVWEKHGFMEGFDFMKTHDNETRAIMSINLVAPIEITKGIAKNLSQSTNPRAIYLGAFSGVDKHASSQVAYSGSKFVLRGAIQSLTVAFKEEGIGFTVINPGNVATEEVLMDIQEERIKNQTPIPMSDIISLVGWILSLSHSVDVGDINLMQRNG